MIKRIIYSLLLIVPTIATGQNFYNLTGVNERALIGTARFVGMGGSMGALGADISVMGVNPAGIALYRRSDCAFTASAEMNNNTSTYEGTDVKSAYTGGRFDNIGLVLVNKINMSDVEFVNVGIAYRANNHFNRNFDMYGAANGFSQQYVIDNLYRRTPFDTGSVTYSMYENLYYDWLALLASDGGLVTETGNLITDSDGNLLYPPTHLGYYSEERGRVDVFDVNISTNIKDRVYLGATFSLSSVNYSRYSYYNEDDEIGEIYSIVNNLRMSGTGFDLKLGAIVRPFEYLPLKVGVAFHTPVWYRLLDSSNASIIGIDGMEYKTTDKERFFDNLNVKYEYRTPWRANASLSYTFGSYLAINAEYEYTDYRSACYTGRMTVGKLQNVDMDNSLRQQHTARIGAELNFDNFALRAGYGYSTAMFASEGYKNLDNMSIAETSTEYMNLYDKNNVTFGLGYRFKKIYIDLAYMLQMQNADFYPFYDVEYVNPVAKVAFTDHTLAFTMGFRF